MTVALVAGVHVGTSSVTAWVREEGRSLATATVPTATRRPAPDRAELDPAAWEAACRQALHAAVEQAGRPGDDYLAVTASSARHGVVLLDASGTAIGPGIHPADRRGGPYAQVLDGRSALTGHRPAAELALPALLAVRAEEPERWQRTARVLFLHDWLVQRLSGVHVTEMSYACAGAMADVAARSWATGLLEECGLGTSRLAPVVPAGTVVGELLPGWALPPTLPVVTGCGDAQLRAAGAGGLADGVVVVDGRTTSVVATTSAPAPAGRAWVSTHAGPGLWAAEGDAGYPLAGAATDVASRAYTVRSDLADLEQALGRPAKHVVVTGDAALAALLAEQLGREVRIAPGGVAPAGEVLAARALGVHAHIPPLPVASAPAGDPAPWQEPYERWRAARPG